MTNAIDSQTSFVASVSNQVPMISGNQRIETLKENIRVIQTVMKDVMKNGEHYGVIPGTGSKPTLLKSGAEKLSFVFHLATEYQIKQTDLPNGHREYEVICKLTSIETGKYLGSGVGICSTMEKNIVIGTIWSPRLNQSQKPIGTKKTRSFFPKGPLHSKPKTVGLSPR
ncbi:hypothetical protein LEP1GSC170_1226 [Leptospira interrogans serovar Bataviae str. HAI135]|nr:hypothetical protein LEP1GSC170_1226 [Leptospira interrogans serovar Bataviae str. HAI135]